MTVRLLQAVRIAGTLTAQGAVISLADQTERELVASNQAAFFVEPSGTQQNTLRSGSGLRVTEMAGGFALFGTNLGASSLETITNYVDGGPAQLLTVAPGADCYAIKTLGSPLRYMSTANTYGFWIYIPDQVSYNAIVLDNQGGAVGVYADLSENDFAHLRSAGQTRQNLSPDVSSNLGLGWNFINLTVGANASGKEYTAATNSPWTNLQTGIGFRVLNGSTQTIRIGFGTPVVDPKSKPTLVWTFDDFDKSHYSVAYQKLSQLGWRGGCLVIPSVLGNAVTGTLAQAREMHDAGWDIMNHTYDHINVTTLPTVDAVALQLTRWRDWARANGFWRGADIFGYPQGGFNDIGIAGVRKAGYSKARATIQKSFNTAYGVDKILVPSIILNYPTTLATYTGYVDNAIAKNESLVIYAHELVTTPANGNQWAIADFEALCDYIKTKELAGQIQVLRPSDFFDQLP